MRARLGIAGWIVGGHGAGRGAAGLGRKEASPAACRQKAATVILRRAMTARWRLLALPAARTLNGRVSFERVVSGIGHQEPVYAFLRDDQKMEEPDWLKRADDDRGIRTAVIGTCARKTARASCAFETMQMFSRGVWGRGGQRGAEGAGNGRHLPGRRYCAQDLENAAKRGHLRRGFWTRGG